MVAQLGAQLKVSIYLMSARDGRASRLETQRGVVRWARRPCPIVALLFLNIETKVQSIGFLSCCCWMWCSSG
jgi:hypothetical protein